MNYFVSRETVKIDIGDNDWIEIKARMGLGEYDRIESIAGKGDEGRIMATLEVNITDWSLTENENPMPVTRENIARLELPTAVKIFGEIGKLNSLAEQQKKA